MNSGVLASRSSVHMNARRPYRPAMAGSAWRWPLPKRISRGRRAAAKRVMDRDLSRETDGKPRVHRQGGLQSAGRRFVGFLPASLSAAIRFLAPFVRILYKIV